MRKQLDWIEERAWMDMVEAMPEAERRAIDLRVEQRHGAMLSLCRPVDSMLLNRVSSLGVGRPVGEPEVADIIDTYRQLGIGSYFVHAYRDDQPALQAALSRLGLAPYRRGWDRLARGRDEPVPRVETSLSLRPARPEDATAMAQIFSQGFDLPEEASAAFAAVAGRRGWVAMVATDDDGTVVGAGTLYHEDGLAYLAGASTLPAYRGRGAQGALMAARVRAALDLGCRLIGSDTGEAVEGDAQHSHRNMRRCGLKVIATRDNYVPRVVLWNHRTPAISA